MVEVDDVDRLDRRLGVGVGGEQGPAGAGEQVHRLFEELEAGHLRHPVVGEHHRHHLAAQLQLAQRLERLAPDSARTTRYVAP